MSKRGENIYKRKDGRWEGRYIKNRDFSGKVQYGYIYGKTYSETKQKLLDAKFAQTLSVKPANTFNISFKEGLELWLQITKRDVKESTFSRYCHLIDTHITPYLGECLMSQTDTMQLEEYVNRLLLSGRVDGSGGLSAKTTTDILMIVKSMSEYVQHLGYSISFNTSRLSVKRKEKPIRILSITEQKKLERTLLTDLNYIKFGILLSLYTGIRLGEICALRWRNFDFHAGTIQIKETMQRIQNTDVGNGTRTKIVFTTPKTKNSSRIIPLPDQILVIAKELSCAPSSFVLTGSPDKYIEPRTMQNHFKKIITESALQDINYHALRHTFATRCVEVGFEIKSLSEILGHATVNITLNRYVHSSFELKRENMNRLLLGSI